MKIGILSKQDEFARHLEEQMKARSAHEYLAWTPGQTPPATDLEVLIVFGAATREQMESQPRLGLVQTASVGFEGIDLDAASSLGIWVSHALSDETGNAASVAEHAVLLLLAAARHLRQEMNFVYRGGPNAPTRPGQGLALEGKTVCLVGLGAIGHALAARLQPFGVKLVVVDGHLDHVPAGAKGYPEPQLHEALATADFTVLCVPGNKENENLIDAAALAAMKAGAFLVNIARGLLVEEAALLESVRSGRLAGAALDVVREEPVAPGNPLLREPRILVTPHIAGMTDLMFAGTVTFLMKALEEYGAGVKMKSVVNQPKHPRVALRG
jgi:phosphoglycerate dehydrogenase-like enzyme